MKELWKLVLRKMGMRRDLFCCALCPLLVLESLFTEAQALLASGLDAS